MTSLPAPFVDVQDKTEYYSRSKKLPSNNSINANNIDYSNNVIIINDIYYPNFNYKTTSFEDILEIRKTMAHYDPRNFKRSKHFRRHCCKISL